MSSVAVAVRCSVDRLSGLSCSALRTPPVGCPTLAFLWPLLWGLISRCWVDPWPPCSALLYVHSLFGPHSPGACRGFAPFPAEALALPVWLTSGPSLCLGFDHTPSDSPYLPGSPRFCAPLPCYPPSVSFLIVVLTVVLAGHLTRSRRVVCGLLWLPLLRGWGPLCAPFLCPCHFPPCCVPLSLSLTLFLLPSLSASRSWSPPVLCAKPLASAVLPAGGLLSCTRDALPILVPPFLRTLLCHGPIPQLCATPAPVPQQPPSLPPRRVIPDRAPRLVLPRPCCSGVPRAPSSPLVHALVAPAASFLGRPPLLLVVMWLAVRPSVAIGLRCAVYRVALACGRAPPLVSAHPCHALSACAGSLLSLSASLGPCHCRDSPLIGAVVGPRWPRPMSLLCACALTARPTELLRSYVSHLRLAQTGVSESVRLVLTVAPHGSPLGHHGSHTGIKAYNAHRGWTLRGAAILA